MIKVDRKPAPRHFNATIRTPGLAWLRRRAGARSDLAKPLPAKGQAGYRKDFWTGGMKWRDAIGDLRGAYDHLCAYAALRLAEGTGSATVDHFIPKSHRPDRAYDWNNIRLSSGRVNGRRGIRPVIDPFRVGDHWFVLEFVGLHLSPNPTLSARSRKRVQDTIDHLGLDSPNFRAERRNKWEHYVRNGDRAFLQSEAPHVYAEAARQGLL